MSITTAIWSISHAQDEIIALMMAPVTAEPEITQYIDMLLSLGLVGDFLLRKMKGGVS